MEMARENNIQLLREFADPVVVLGAVHASQSIDFLHQACEVDKLIKALRAQLIVIATAQVITSNSNLPPM